MTGCTWIVVYCSDDVRRGKRWEAPVPEGWYVWHPTHGYRGYAGRPQPFPDYETAAAECKRRELIRVEILRLETEYAY